MSKCKTMLPPITPEIWNRFWSKVDKSGSCWNWLAGRRRGYGQFHVVVGMHNFPAHRVAYLMFNGLINREFELDHLCRNRACVNPNHLEPVSGRTNVLRGTGIATRNAQKMHCKWGHPLTGKNVYITKNGQRHCQPCVVRRTREWRQRRDV